MTKLKFTLIAAISLDGYISRTSHANAHMDWTSKEDWTFFQDKLGDMDAVIVGRNTFEVAESRLRKRNTFVLSKQHPYMRREDSVTWVHPGHHDISRILAEEHHHNIAILGGREVYTWAIENGFCNELFLTIEPIILGDGIRFLSTLLEKNLELRSSTILNAKGTLLLHYILSGSSHR